MPEARVTVVIPVAPWEYSWRWLDECLESVRAQTLRADEVLIIDDMAGLATEPPFNEWDLSEGPHLLGHPETTLWASPWRLGVAHAFNFGVALARNELVFMACSDDALEPECLERCVEAWEANGRKDAFYCVSIRYMGTDEIQDLPAHQGLVTKGLWRETGGFPV